MPAVREEWSNLLAHPEHAPNIDVPAAFEDLVGALEDAPLVNVPGIDVNKVQKSFLKICVL